MKKKRFFCVFLVISALIGLVFYYFKVIVPQVSYICSTIVKSVCSDAVNMTVLYSLDGEIKYSDFITVDKNADGEVVFMSVDSFKANALNKTIAIKTREKLEETLKNGLSIPIMAFSGLKLLSGYGPKVDFKAITVSAVGCDFESVFKSVGINQTLHSLYVKVNCAVSVDMPLNNSVSEFSTSVLLSESVLIGKVPDTFLNGNLFA